MCIITPSRVGLRFRVMRFAENRNVEIETETGKDVGRRSHARACSLQDAAAVASAGVGGGCDCDGVGWAADGDGGA